MSFQVIRNKYKKIALLEQAMEPLQRNEADVLERTAGVSSNYFGKCNSKNELTKTVSLVSKLGCTFSGYFDSLLYYEIILCENGNKQTAKK